jgi:hypothetical protein
LCAHCGAPLREDQQWCLNCGACEPGSLVERPNWRPLTALGLTAAVLAAGAAVAVAAAFNEHKSPPATVALVPATPAVTVPAATTPATTTPALPATPPTSTAHAPKGSASNLLFPPSSTGKPPKISTPAATPKSSGGSSTGESTGSHGGSTTTAPAKTNTTKTGTSTAESKSKEGAGGSEQEKPTPILLDTNSASTYNPYNYPESGFGDPALAIDGEPSTAWTAQIQAHSFPSMAEGLLIDLRSATKLGKIELRTPTRGVTVQVYGANGAKAPATITDPGWAQLSGSHMLKKAVTHLKLGTGRESFRWLVVWIVKAPAAAQGTPQAPGHVALSEVELYPPA